MKATNEDIEKLALMLTSIDPVQRDLGEAILFEYVEHDSIPNAMLIIANRVAKAIDDRVTILTSTGKVPQVIWNDELYIFLCKILTYTRGYVNIEHTLRAEVIPNDTIDEAI